MRIRILLLCLTLLAASAFIAHASKPEIAQIREPLSGIPMSIGTWVGQPAPDIDSRVLEVLGVDDYVNRIYYSPDLYSLSLYIGYYQSQRQGDTIHSPLNCLPGAGWNPVKTARVTIQTDDHGTIEINRILIQKGIEEQVVLYWYQSHGRIIASEYWGKIYTVLDALRTNRTDAALVRIVCPVRGMGTNSEVTSGKRAVGFVRILFPILNRFLPA